ncbi:MAG: recombinase family protein, partial [Bacteriovorax sp.]
MSIKNNPKVNDLSSSPLRAKFLTKEFTPETNLAIAFGRVSTKRQQDQGNSDIAQLESMEKYAQDKNLKIVKSWDVAETASKPNKRTKFHEMIKHVREHSDIKHVIFSHQSRSNRNRESARELETLLKLGVVLHFSRDQRTISSQSEIDELLMWDVNNILNEKFIRDHTKNVMDGTIKRVEAGLFPGKAPFGYKNFRREDQLSIFILDPINSLYVKAAFEMFSTGNYTLASLKKELDDKYPAVINKPGIKRFGEMLRMPFYYGKFLYDGVLYDGHPEYHPILVPYPIWNKVQNVFNSEERIRFKVTEKAHPYVGIMKCGGKILDIDGYETEELCGCAITAEEKRKKLANGTIKNF